MKYAEKNFKGCNIVISLKTKYLQPSIISRLRKRHFINCMIIRNCGLNCVTKEISRNVLRKCFSQTILSVFMYVDRILL